MIYEALHLDFDEHVILEVRKHWIVFLGQVIGLLFAAIFPLILLFVFKMYIPGVAEFDLPGNDFSLVLFFYVLWLLSIWISFFVNWTKYYLDVWYVTDKRIIIVDQRKIFDREISNIRFDKIQDITVNVDGFIPTLLGFGNLKVQTASEDNTDFSIHTVRSPERVRMVVFGKHNEIGDRGL